MITTRNINFVRIFSWSGHHVIWLSAFMTSVALLYHYKLLTVFIPWLPIGVIGTAVAFYVGFKNNQAYDRMWEARKIWGGIVNTSRTWGMQVDGYLSDQFAERRVSQHEIQKAKRRLVNRHIKWLYTLREQLLKPTEWEHISQSGKVRRIANYFQENYGIGLVQEELGQVEKLELISAEEQAKLSTYKNAATQLINGQSRELMQLRADGMVDDFRHMELVQTLAELYEHQGKCERLKKFPLPRQYAMMSKVFVGIFVFMLPFGLAQELVKMGDWAIWLTIPISTLIGWIFVMMEVVGDYSENPFQGMANDIPMLSLCRTIEIDLLEMMGETEVPSPIPSRKGILM